MSKIEYPRKRGEAELQALLWYFLRKRKIDARLEVSARNGRSYRLDIVIFRDKQAICIVECKSWSARYSILRAYQRGKNTKQIQRYKEAFNLPVLVIGRFNQITPTIEEIEKILRS